AASRFNERLQDRLEIKSRAADDLEYVGGRSLLLKRFAQLVEQASTLDRDDRLRGEGLDPLDLLVRKRADLLAIDADRADQLILLDHRGDKERASAAEIGEHNEPWITFKIRRHRPSVLDVHDLLGPEHLSMGVPRMGTECLVPPRLGVCRRNIVKRNNTKFVSVV